MQRIDTRMEYMATKEDIQSIKTLLEERLSSALKWQVSILAVVVIGLVGAIIRSFF